MAIDWNPRLTELSPKLQGRPNTSNSFHSLHWESRKLLISEIRFITDVWHVEDIIQPKCVYLGPSPDRHIEILSDLFPKIHFFCYDLSYYGIKPVDDRISIFSGEPDGLFHLDIAADFANREDVIFICNHQTKSSVDILMDEFDAYDLKFEKGLQRDEILAQNPGPDTELIWRQATRKFRERERTIIVGDLAKQKSWLLQIRPRFALLRFRLPHPMYSEGDEDTDRLGVLAYVEGYNYWQSWSALNSNEVKIQVDRPGPGELYLENVWNIRTYAQQCRYHNVVERRTERYEPIALDGKELLTDFDSVNETQILATYLRKFGDVPDSEIEVAVIELSRIITTRLGGANLSQRRMRKEIAPNYKISDTPVHYSDFPVDCDLPPIGDEPQDWYDPRWCPRPWYPDGACSKKWLAKDK